jgi:hypothetical protein
MRWSLLKKPVNLSPEERKAIEELEKADAGFVQSFRNIIRQLVNIFDRSHSESQVKLRVKQLRTDIEAAEDNPTLTPARYMNAVKGYKSIAYWIYNSEACM